MGKGDEMEQYHGVINEALPQISPPLKSTMTNVKNTLFFKLKIHTVKTKSALTFH